MSTYFYVYPFGVNAMGDLSPVSTLPDGNLVSYSQGWPVNYQQDLLTISTAEPINRQQTNQMFYDITNNINQYQTQGVPLWITAGQNTTIANPSGVPFPYPLYARVAYNSSNPNYIQIWENQVDGNTATPGADNTWVVISGNAQGTMPGTIIDFGGVSAPAGYLVCNGDQVSRAGYARLYAAIGTTWGIGDGSTTFNLPLLQTYVSAGAGGAGIPGIGSAVGSKGGSPTAALSNNNQLPLHSHTALTGSFLVNDITTSPAGHLVSGSQTVGLSGTTSSIGSASPQPFPIVQATALVLKCIKY